ncbi:MAG: M23 family metallopeptidase [Thermodesulfobacteriota bacterium]|nr:MAG: M23 family metallopeptidase [Thermodesulfobacteriota bacterium]
MPLKVLFLILALVLSNSCAATITNYKVDLSDETLPQGGVTLIHIGGGPAGQAVSASFGGGEVFTIEAQDGAWGIVAADLETKPGTYELSFGEGKVQSTTALQVVAGDYGTTRLRLPRDMVEFDEKTLHRIKKEQNLLRMVWAGSSPKPLWNAPFSMPLKGRITGHFGSRRILNGSPRSPHGGLDIAAPAGTPVKAANRGRVAFVGDFFFYGRFMVIDHGLGVFTLYAHLNSVEAGYGQVVKAGAVIGRVGATGRATGPHLHFSVKVGDVRVSPDRFFEVTERLMRHMALEASGGHQVKGSGVVRGSLNYGLPG